MTTPLPGDFGLVSIEGGVGFAIRLGQFLNGDGFRNYEHAFIYIGNGQIVEAEPGGARISQLSEYDGRSILWSTELVDLNARDRQDICSDVVAFVGTPYSFLDYLCIALYRFHLKVPGVTNRVEKSKHMICSQLVATVYHQSGINMTKDPAYLITPGKLTKYLLALKKANDRA